MADIRLVSEAKALDGEQQYAAEFGLALVVPDTSPRDLSLPGKIDEMGAGFHVNVTHSPLTSH